MFNLVQRIFIYALLVLITVSIGGCKPGDSVQFKAHQKFQSEHIKWIENVGQYDENIAFVYNNSISGVRVLKNGAIQYILSNKDKTYVIQENVKSVTTNPQGLLISPSRVNYFKGEAKNHRSYIPVYHQVYLGEAWPEIHCYLNAEAGTVEKLLKIMPGADIDQIGFELKGIDFIDLAENTLILEIDSENLSFSEPVAWQEINGSVIDIDAAYMIDDNNLSYGFKLGTYNHDYPLFIDPVLSSSFLGGSGTEEIETIKVISDGSVILGGSTSSMNFPVTPGSYDSSHNDTTDIFIARMSKDLKDLEACTFIGGEGRDVLEDLKVYGNGNIYIGGSTRSVDYPTSINAYDRSYNNPGATVAYKDMVVSALSPGLDQLLHSTFLGTTTDDYCTAIDFDSSGDLCLIGFAGRIPSVGPQFNANTSGCVFAKFNSTLSILIATNSVSGNNFIWPDDIVVDGNDNIFLCAHTRATNFPATIGSYATNNSGSQDAVLFKVNNAMSVMLAATYFGGDREDLATKLMLDDNGNVYATGYTKSSDFPVSPGAYSTGNTSSFSSDIFITKLSSNLDSLLLSTLAGGGGSDESYDISMDSKGNVFITGTAGWGFPVFCDSYQSNWSTIDDGLIASFDPSLSTLISSTYLSTSGDDVCLSLAINPGDTVYVGGFTSSPNFPVTMSFDTTYNGGNEDAFVLAINPELNGSEPCCPDLISPLPGSVNLPSEFDIEWENARNANGYLLSVGTEMDQWDIINDLDVGNVTMYTLNNLPCGDTIYISIQPYNDFGVKTNCEVYFLAIGGGFFTEEYFEICEGEMFMWEGESYDTEGTYQSIYIDENGCDSIIQLTLAVHPEYYIQETAMVCEGDSYDWHNSTYFLEGLYYDSLTSLNGCDSVFELNLELLPNYEFSESEVICEGETYDWQGMVLDQSGTYTVKLLSSENCDSILILDLEVKPSYLNQETYSICEGEEYEWQGMMLDQSGTYNSVLVSSDNCDSILVLELIVFPTYLIQEANTICEGDSYDWQGMIFDQPGVFMVSYNTGNGCDSIYELVLDNWPSYHSQELMETCESNPVNWQGMELDSSGLYQLEYNTQFGCDSIFELNLTVYDEYYFQDEYEICDSESFDWQGNVYSEPGVYVQEYSSINGCDSIYELTLEVNPGYSTYEEYELCDGDTLLWNGLMLSSEGEYEIQYLTDELCDSIININLIVNTGYSFHELTGLCEGDFIEWEGQTIGDPGYYSVEYQSFDGCDSIHNLEVLAYPEFEFLETISLCTGDQLDWQGLILDQPGDYELNYITQYGCDSTYHLELELISPDTSVTVWNDTLETPFNPLSTYQWLNCQDMSLIEGETSSEYVPESSGEYSVIVEFEGCIDTSMCYYVQSTSIGKLESSQFRIIVFPNPLSNGLMNLEIQGISGRYEVLILDINGKVLHSEFDYTKTKSIHTGNLLPGVYFVLVQFEGRRFIQRIIVA